MRTVVKIQVAAGLYRIISGARKLVGAGDFVRVVRKGLTWELDLSEGIDLAPTDCAFGKLERNIELNPELASQIVAEQFRLTGPDAADTGEIYSSWKVAGQRPRHQKHLGIAKSIVGARAISLDEYWKKTGLQRLDFIKLDVDGFEVEVLRGGSETLRRYHPSICMELSPHVLEERGASLAELLAQLRDGGYRLLDLATGSAITDSKGRLKVKIPDGSGSMS